MSRTKPPSIKFLIGFEAAARLGNYSRAADELHLSPSAISHQIAQLEEQVGQPLFRRKGRGVEVTVAGRLMLDSVTKALGQIQGGLARIETYLDENLVTLVCPAPIALGWLQPRVDQLLQEHARLRPIICVDETLRYVDQMDVDIAISRKPLKQRGVLEVPLLSDALVPVGSPELGDRLSSLAPESHPQVAGLLCLEGDLTGDRVGPFIRKHFAALRKVAIYDDARLVLDAALRGRGLALVSQLLADDALRSGRLVQLAAYPSLPMGAVWISRAEGEPRLPLVRAVFDSLLRYSQAT